MFRPSRSAVAVVVLGLALTSCSPAPSPPPAAPALPPTLWGDMKPVVSVKELMRDLIDPLADNIFNAVGSTTTKQGTVDIVPKTDEDWAKIRVGAVAMAETAYLLKVKRPFTPPGDENNSQGPDAVELSPAEITAKVEKDPVEWNARVEAMRNVGLAVLDVVNRKAVDELWDASENLDAACEACHRSYWYPKEDAQFYQKLRDRLDTFSKSGAATTPAPAKKP